MDGEKAQNFADPHAPVKGASYAMKGTHAVNPPLPDFENPPVVEVALSVQWAPLSKLCTEDLAVYWRDVLGEKWKWKEAAEVPASFEWFGIPQPPNSIGFSFQQFEVPPPHRALFFRDDTELVQLQRDRLVRNWRKAGSEPYPRYEFIRTNFREQFVSLSRFVAERKLGPCLPNQCEVTYVNHIPWGSDGQPPMDLAAVLSTWSAKGSDSFLGTPEQVEVAAHYVINTEAGPVGRLHVAASPGVRAGDLQPLLTLTLTARGRPVGEGIEDVLTFLDLGREHVVRGFASITTPAMHERWGRRA
jgi:uncharacterized protein (TIGR04255 family)